MVERQRPTPAQETSPLHEQGGLTTEHWQYIASLDFDDPRINQYAQAKAAGLIDEEQGPFIGSRHWQNIYYEMLKRTEDYGKLVGFVLRRTNFHLSQGIREFAGEEKSRVATFDDYYSQKGEAFYLDDASSWGGGVPASKVYWVPEKNTWQQDSFEIVYRLSASCEERSTFTANNQIILDHWLLMKEEVENPIHTSPNELLRIVREEVPVEELIERVRQKRSDYQLVVGWEKPIPKATQER